MNMSEQPLSFSGRRILLIGSGGGIGSAARCALVAAGAEVVCVDQPAAGADLPSKGPFLPVDLNKPGSVRFAVESAWRRHGPIDVLIHAAGLFPARRAVDTEEELLDMVLRVNTGSPLFAATALARLCEQHERSASVVFVSSAGAERSRPGTTVYAASKAALNAVVRGLALEFGPLGVRVNAVAPGFVDVASKLNPVPDGYIRAVRAATPLGRTADANDIVPSLLWLSHEASAWVTGHVLRADGGAGLGSPDAPSWLPD